MSDATAIILALVLLLTNAFFVGAEFALVSARRTQIEPLAEDGSRRAQTTLTAMRQVSLMMAGAQLGITLCTLGLGAIGEPAVAHQLEPLFEVLGMPESLLHPVAFVVATLIVVALHVVIGEMVPKNMALAKPEGSAMTLGPPLLAMVRVSGPFIRGLNAIANGVLRVLGVQPQDEVITTATTREVADMISESSREGLMDSDEADLVTGALTFQDRTAAHVAIDAEDVFVVSPDTTVCDIEALAGRTGHSRFPVQTTDGSWSGYVHLKDIISDGADPGRLVRDLPVRELRSVSGDARLVDVLATMRAGSSALASVDGETGSPAGLLTLDDVLTALIPSRDDRP